jgi:hypothetical protein
MLSLKKSLVFGCALFLTALLFITGCPSPSNSDTSDLEIPDSDTPFVAVTDITGVPPSGTEGVEANLSGATVVPANASYKAINWSVKDAGTTGLSTEGIVNGKFTPGQSGTLVLTATVSNGSAEGTDYTKDFTIGITPLVPVITKVVPADLTSLTATWTTVPGATSYEVYYNTDGTPPDSDTAGLTTNVSISNTTATITSLSSGTVYYIWVRAKTNTGTSDYSTVQTGVLYDPAQLTSLIGTWDSLVDYFVITDSTIKYDDGYPDNPGDFAGNIKYVDGYATGKGIIIIEYTEIPGSPYTTGPDTNYLGIYYELITSGSNTGSFRIANAYDTTNTATDSLVEALTKYTGAAESTFVTITPSPYRKQPDTVFNMGPLLGNWTGDDDIQGAMFGTTTPTPTEMKISDHRLTVFMGGISPSTRWYSGAIVDRTDPSLNSGYIWIQCTHTLDRGLLDNVLDASVNDYYAIYWYKNGSKYQFSIYNDNEDVLSSDLGTLKTRTNLNPYFLEYNEVGYAGDNDGMACARGGNEGVYVGFTKQ